jgi:SAM-dependent methyltransferase
VKLSLHFPVGVFIAGRESRLWVRVIGAAAETIVRCRWRPESSHSIGDAPSQVLANFGEPGFDLEVEVTAPHNPGAYTLALYATDELESPAAAPALSVPATVVSQDDVPTHLLTNVIPLSYAWGVDRGLPVHRMHLERFLSRYAADIKGHCLEFQEPRYVPRFGGTAVRKLDILHADHTNPRATLVADLTKSNTLPDARFDCIVCTHVLQSIFDVQQAVAELHRILAPGGVLLVAEPQISQCDSRYDELWRFTRDGLTRLLLTAFAPAELTTQAYGNSLTAAGELRGMVAAEFSEDVLSTHDYRFATEICARAVKT